MPAIFPLLAALAAFVARPDPCPAPADLAAGADAIYAAPAEGGPDLAPPIYRPPERISVPLRLYLPPPAPFGSAAELGAAAVDLKSGAVAFGEAEPAVADGDAAPPAAAPWSAPGAPASKASRSPATSNAAAPRMRDCR